MKWQQAQVKEGNDKFFKIQEGQNRVRVLSEPVKIWVSFLKGNDGKPEVKKYLEEVLAMEDIGAKARYCFWVIDRVDQKVKLAEVGSSIINQISVLAQDADYRFDTIPGYDLKINRSGSGMETRYDVIAAPAAPLTDVEQGKIVELESVEGFLKKQPGIVLTSQRLDGLSIPF